MSNGSNFGGIADQLRGRMGQAQGVMPGEMNPNIGGFDPSQIQQPYAQPPGGELNRQAPGVMPGEMNPNLGGFDPSQIQKPWQTAIAPPPNKAPAMPSNFPQAIMGMRGGRGLLG